MVSNLYNYYYIFNACAQLQISNETYWYQLKLDSPKFSKLFIWNNFIRNDSITGYSDNTTQTLNPNLSIGMTLVLFCYNLLYELAATTFSILRKTWVNCM